MKDQISGLFLLFAIILGNLLYGTIGNQLEDYVEDNIIVKYIIIFIIIYYTVGFTNEISHPFEHFKHSVLLFLLFIMATRNYLSISILSFIFIIINFTINSYIKYYENNEDDIKKDEIDELIPYSRNLTIIIIIVVFVGFISKIMVESKKKKFNLLEYLIK